MTDPITPSPLPGGADVTPADGKGAATAVVQLKDVLSKELGKEFKDDQSALKAVKDTFAYVGKTGKYEKAIEAVKAARGIASDEDAIKYVMETIAPATPAAPAAPAGNEQVTARLDSLQAELRQAQFYNEHPEYKAHKDLIARFGNEPDKVVETPEFKGLFDKLQRADELEKSKSVVHSNPRLATVTDKVQQSRDALKTGDHGTAKANAMAAVNESLKR